MVEVVDQDAGVVDQDVELAVELGFHEGLGCGDGVVGLNDKVEGDEIVSGGFAVGGVFEFGGEFGGCGFGRFVVTAGEDDRVVVISGQGEGDCAPDAPVGAGYEGDGAG